jgi:flagellar hook-length control protein FliK
MPSNDRKVSQSERFAPKDVSVEVSKITRDDVYDVREALSQSGSSAATPVATMPLAVAQFAPNFASELKGVNSVETDALLAMQATAEIVSSSSRGAESFARSPVPLVPQEVLKIAEQLRAGIRMDRYPLEIALDPPELGQVRMVLQTGEATTTLLIIADRPETADLMRRNASFLHDAFAQEGKGGLNLQFGTSADAERGSGQGGGRSDNGSTKAVDVVASVQGAEPQPRMSPINKNPHSGSTSGLNLTF